MIMARKSAATQRLESAPLLIRRIDAIPVSIPLVQPVLMGGGQKNGSVECPSGPGLGV